MICKMQAMRKFIAPMDRQIEESVMIKQFVFDNEDGIVMVSGSEWREDPVARAVFGTNRSMRSISIKAMTQGLERRRGERGRKRGKEGGGV